MKENITVKDVVDFLNEILEADYDTVNALFSMRVPCNTKLAEHKTVQVGTMYKSFYIASMIGIINGMFGVDELGRGRFGVDFDEGNIKEFIVIDYGEKDENA